MPGDAFPLGQGGGLCLGTPWKWFVSEGGLPGTRTLFAFDSRKEEHRIWQSQTRHGASRLLLRVEHHGADPGWHAHSPATPEDDTLLAHRRAVASGQFPAIHAAGLWQLPAIEERRLLFPEEAMTPATISAIAEALAETPEHLTIRPVPFGLGVGLSERAAFGDAVRLYICQLGREPGYFRIEDDGTTIPLLQGSGGLAATRYLRPHAVLGTRTRGSLHFAPENRALFTPYFPLDELAERLAEFAWALETFAGLHSAGGTPAGQSSDTSNEPGDTGSRNDIAGNDNSAQSTGNAWTQGRSYATV